MVTSATDIGDRAPTPAEPQAAQRATEASAVSGQPAGAEAPAANGTALADVVQRLARLEAAVSRMAQAGGAGGQAQANVPALAQQLQALSGSVQEILQYLPNTLGYGVRATFQCRSCSAQKLVASSVLCTNCKTETWVGWWPQR